MVVKRNLVVLSSAMRNFSKWIAVIGALTSVLFSQVAKPAGGKVAFIRFREGKFPGYGFGDLYFGQEGDVKPKRLLEYAAYPAWSPDGQLIAVGVAGVGDPPRICTVDPTNSEVKCIFKDRNVMATSPSWAPEGKRLVFVCEKDLCVINADGSALTKLTRYQGKFGAQRPVWSPDGKTIAFMAFEGTKSRIATIAPDGSNLQMLTPDSKDPHDDCHPAWSPDGNFILFSSDRGGKYEIYMMQRDGSGMKKIYSHNVYRLQAPVGTPDGRLAFDALSENKMGAAANNDQFWPESIRHPQFPRSLFGWQRECFVLSADGKEVHHIFPDQCGYVAFQPIASVAIKK